MSPLLHLNICSDRLNFYNNCPSGPPINGRRGTHPLFRAILSPLSRLPLPITLYMYLVAPGPLNIYINSSPPPPSLFPLPAKTTTYKLLSPLPSPPARHLPTEVTAASLSARTRILFPSSRRTPSLHVYHNERRHHHSHYLMHVDLRRPAALLPFVSAPLLAGRISKAHQSPCTAPLLMSRMLPKTVSYSAAA